MPSSPQLCDRALIDGDDRHILSRSQRIYFQHSPSDQAHPDRLLVACRHDPNRLDRPEALRCRRCTLAISPARLPAVIFQPARTDSLRKIEPLVNMIENPWDTHDFAIRMLDWSATRGSRLAHTC